MARRKHIPTEIETRVITLSGRRCCICFGLDKNLAVKKGQVAHLDRNPANWKLENLAWLCLDHHDEYDTRTSQTKGLTIREVKHYRGLLYAKVKDLLGRHKRAKAAKKRSREKGRKLNPPEIAVIPAAIYYIEDGMADISPPALPLSGVAVQERGSGEAVIGSNDELKEITNAASALVSSLEPFRTGDPEGVSVAARMPFREALNQLRVNYAKWQLAISPRLGEQERRIVHSIGQHSLGMKNLRKGEEVMRIRETILAYTGEVTRR